MTIRQLAFISLQDLKGSVYLWWSTINQMVLIYIRFCWLSMKLTKELLPSRQTKLLIHFASFWNLFKALAKGEFSEEQIYNWSYVMSRKLNYFAV